jgi:putative phage-type endonuclease
MKTGRSVQAANHAMLRGTELEPAARLAYEQQTGLVMQPLVLEGGAYSASLDGMTLDGDLILEIKRPMRGSGSKLWQDVAAGVVPEHYLVQVQHQLMIGKASKAHLWVFHGAKGVLHCIERDEACMQRIKNGWDSFQPFLDGDTPPPLTDANTLVRSDAEWVQAATAFAAAKRAADAATECLERARTTLVALAAHPREQRRLQEGGRASGR